MILITKKTKYYLIVKKNYNQIIKRTMLHAGTKLYSNEKILYQNMIYKFINYAKKGDFSPESHLNFCESILNIDIRLGQHLIETIFYKQKYNITTLREILKSDITLSNQFHTNYVDNAYIISAIHGKMLRQNNFFKKGKLTVLEPPQSEKNVDLDSALKDTGQKFPDYVFEHLLDNDKKIIRHYDLKTTTFDLFKHNKGHVLSVADTLIYEKYVEKVLKLQAQSYGSKYPEIRKFFADILNSKDSWTVRNDKVHEFYLNILHKYPDIRPSLVFKHDLAYDSKNIAVPKYIETIMSYYNIADSRDISEKALAHALLQSGDVATNNFTKGSQHNQNIKNSLKEMLQKWIENDA